MPSSSGLREHVCQNCRAVVNYLIVRVSNLGQAVIVRIPRHASVMEVIFRLRRLGVHWHMHEGHISAKSTPAERSSIASPPAKSFKSVVRQLQPACMRA